MNKIYNNQEEIATNFADFFKKVFPNIRKTQLNIIPYIIIGMLFSESCVASDIAKKLKGNFSLVQFDSVVKRIHRFFRNSLFNPYVFYDKIISYVIDNYKLKHNDKRVHIVFDHMFSRNHFTVFMITLRIGKSGIPIWFRCFYNKDNDDAFNESLIKEGISYVSNLFKDKDCELIFLADRWFNSVSLLKHIDKLKHTFCIRIKRNIKVLVFDKKEKHNIWKFLSELKHYKNHSHFLFDIPLTEERFKVNIAFSSSVDTADPWIIITNGKPKRAIKDYGYRFGGIETVFKNQKSNGIYLEDIVNASPKYFERMYTLACVCVLFCSIFGADFSKNTKCYKNVNIKTHTTSHNKRIRILSLFNTGLTLFSRAYNSCVYIRIPFNFILYDI